MPSAKDGSILKGNSGGLCSKGQERKLIIPFNLLDIHFSPLQTNSFGGEMCLF